MVIDDNQGVLELLGDLLEDLRAAEVCRYHSGEEALKAFNSASQDFQFVVTDLEMPGIDGIELCRRLHAVAPRLKILLTTGSQIITEFEAIRSGFCGLLPKPFPAGALRKAVETAGLFNHALRGATIDDKHVTTNEAALAAA